MDLQRIKQLIKNTGDRFVFVEDGEASLVVMDFWDYERLLRNRGANFRAGVKDTDLVAASFETERMRQRQEEVSAWGLADIPRAEQRTENIRLEDLPL